MSDSDSDTGKAVVGCFGLGWKMFVTSPMFLVLLFAILYAIEVETWAWVLYWCYVPAFLLGAILNAILKQVFSD